MFCVFWNRSDCRQSSVSEIYYDIFNAVSIFVYALMEKCYFECVSVGQFAQPCYHEDTNRSICNSYFGRSAKLAAKCNTNARKHLHEPGAHSKAIGITGHQQHNSAPKGCAMFINYFMRTLHQQKAQAHLFSTHNFLNKTNTQHAKLSRVWFSVKFEMDIMGSVLIEASERNIIRLSIYYRYY